MQKHFVIDTNYSSYTVVRRNFGDRNNIADDELGRGFKHIRKTINDIERCNEHISRNLFRYVYQIIKNGSFNITDPKSGNKVRLGATYTFDDFQTIFFFFSETSLIGVVASDLSAGFPLSTIIFFDERLIVRLTNTFWGIGERHFDALSANRARTVYERAEGGDVCLLAGDPNFAHHVWNELSSLQEIAAAGLDEGLSLAVVHEPLGPINALIGSRFKVIRKLTKAQTPEINALAALTFCSGGNFVNSKLVSNIVKFAESNLGNFASEVRDVVMAHGPRSLWVSVRTRNRTLADQVEVLTAIIREYLAGRPDRLVIVDGHSLPFDYDQDADYIKDLNDSIVRDDIMAADEIIAGVKGSLPDANIIRFVGQKIPESIAVARHVGFYFCHHGTVQHKLGWFSSVPGLVHCNREVLEIRPDQWVKQQSEVAALPTYVSLDLVDDEIADADAGELRKHLHQNNYKISDRERAIQIVRDFAVSIEESC